MSSSELLEEIQIIESIYGHDGSFFSFENDPHHFQMKIIDENEDSDIQVSLDFLIPKEYPDEPPLITTLLNIDDDIRCVENFTSLLKIEATKRLGEPMIYDLIELAREQLSTLHNEIKNEQKSLWEKDPIEVKQEIKETKTTTKDCKDNRTKSAKRRNFEASLRGEKSHWVDVIVHLSKTAST